MYYSLCTDDIDINSDTELSVFFCHIDKSTWSVYTETADVPRSPTYRKHRFWDADIQQVQNNQAGNTFFVITTDKE